MCDSGVVFLEASCLEGLESQDLVVGLAVF